MEGNRRYASIGRFVISIALAPPPLSLSPSLSSRSMSVALFGFAKNMKSSKIEHIFYMHVMGGNSCLRHAIENRFDSDATCPMGYKKEELSLQMSHPFPPLFIPLSLSLCVYWCCPSGQLVFLNYS